MTTPTTTPSPRQRRRLGLVATVAALSLAFTGCGSSGGDDKAASDDPSSTTASSGGDGDGSTTTTAAEVGFVRDAGFDLPRSTTYAGVELTVDDASFSNGTLATYGQDEPEVDDAERLFLDLVLEFAEGYPGTDSLLPISKFAVVTADGTEIPAEGLEMAAELPITTSATTEATLAFELTEDDLDGASLVYDDAEHEPAVLPLDGDVAEAAYPIRSEVGETATADFPTGCEPVPADVELVATEWDVDGGVDGTGAKIVEGQSSRALVGERWVRAEVRVTAGAGQCGGTHVNHEAFRVSADGSGVTPVNEPSESLEDGASTELTLGFAVPVDAEEVELVVGHADATTHAFALSVPDELP